MTVKHGSSPHRHTIPISLLLKCKSSYAKYVQFLEDQKAAVKRAEKSKKKSLILDAISTVQKKKNKCKAVLCIT